MATFSKILLSGSINGKQIKVANTVSPGTIIHTVPAGTTSLDEIWIYATNSSGGLASLTLQWGETNGDGNMTVGIPSKDGRHLIVDGKLLQNGLTVYAFSNTADVILIDGFVNRIA